LLPGSEELSVLSKTTTRLPHGDVEMVRLSKASACGSAFAHRLPRVPKVLMNLPSLENNMMRELLGLARPPSLM
jgi:hypothetical protein